MLAEKLIKRNRGKTCREHKSINANVYIAGLLSVFIIIFGLNQGVFGLR
jgi:hypothetical protein